MEDILCTTYLRVSIIKENLRPTKLVVCGRSSAAASGMCLIAQELTSFDNDCHEYDERGREEYAKEHRGCNFGVVGLTCFFIVHHEGACSRRVNHGLLFEPEQMRPFQTQAAHEASL